MLNGPINIKISNMFFFHTSLEPKRVARSIPARLIDFEYLPVKPEYDLFGDVQAWRGGTKNQLNERGLNKLPF